MEMETEVAKALWRSIATRVKTRRVIKKKATTVSWSSDLVQERIIISSSSEEETEVEEDKEATIKSPISMEEGELSEGNDQH